MLNPLVGRTDVYKFWVGDSYDVPPEGARLADLTLDDPTLYRYGAPRGDNALIAALVAKLETTNGIHVSPEQVVVTAGATHALDCAARAVLSDGDEVLVFTPNWAHIRGHILGTGARIVDVPLYAALREDPSSCAAVLEKYITPRTAALYFAQPNNPDGAMLTPAQLEAVAELARRHDLWVFADEVYERMAFDMPLRSFATLDGMAERTLTCYSCSKTYAMAGLRIGYLVGPKAAIARSLGASYHSIFNVPLVLQRAALEAMRKGETFLRDSRARALEARDLAYAALAPFGAQRPAGGIYLFMDLAPLAGPGRTSADVFQRLIAAGAPPAPGEIFGPAYGSWGRFCFAGMSPDRLREGLKVLTAALAAERGL